MLRSRVLFPRYLKAALVPILGILSVRLQAQNQPKDQSAAGHASQPQYQLEVTSDLVIVRVAVRDSQGKPVTGLAKEDFRLFDRGKEQKISQFEEEVSYAAAPAPAPVGTPSVPLARPERPSPRADFWCCTSMIWICPMRT